MTDLSLKQDDHPAHNMPPHQNYTHPNNVIFDYDTSSDGNKGQGPTVENTQGEAAADYAVRKSMREGQMWKDNK